MTAATYASSATTALTGTTETVVIASGAVPVNAPRGQGVKVSVTVSGTMGSTQTSAVVKLYRGTDATGTQIGPAAGLGEVQGGGGSFTMNATFLDTGIGVPATPTGTMQYAVTVTQAGGSGNGAMVYASVSFEPASAGGN